MKKIYIFIVVLIVAAMMVSPAAAKSENSNGAVRANIVEFVPPPPRPPDGCPPLCPPPPPPPQITVVGSAILNATASGKVIVNVNIDTEPDLIDYDVVVAVHYLLPPSVPGAVAYVYDILNTNASGQGNAQVEVDIDPPERTAKTFGWLSMCVKYPLRYGTRLLHLNTRHGPKKPGLSGN